MQNAPTFTPAITARLQPGDKGFIGPVPISNTTNITNNVTGVNMTDPNTTTSVITNGIKYGTAVTVSSANLAIFGNAPKVTKPTSNFTYGSGNPYMQVK
jgi:hypothetical protein